MCKAPKIAKKKFIWKEKFTWSYLDWGGWSCNKAQPEERRIVLGIMDKQDSIYHYVRLNNPSLSSHPQSSFSVCLSDTTGCGAQLGLDEVRQMRQFCSHTSLGVNVDLAERVGMQHALNPSYKWKPRSQKKANNPRNNKALFEAGNRQARSSA